MSHTRFIWTGNDALSQNVVDWSPILDFTKATGIESVNTAADKLNSKEILWAHSVAFVKSARVGKWFKLIGKPVPMTEGVPSKWELDKTKKIESNDRNPLLDYSSQSSNSVSKAIVLLNSDNNWNYDTAFVNSATHNSWYKLWRTRLASPPTIIPNPTPVPTKRTTVVAFDFDMTLTNVHIYSDWGNMSKVAKKYLQPAEYFDMIQSEDYGSQDLSALLVIPGGVPSTVGQLTGYLRGYMENLQKNNIKICIVTYGIKAVVVEFFKRVGMEHIFNDSNIIGWKEGFAGVEGFDGNEIYNTTAYSTLSKRGKNDFILNFIRSQSIDINNSNVYLVDDTVNNINALDVLRAEFPLAKFTGITDKEEKQKGTHFYIDSLKTVLETDKELSTVMDGGEKKVSNIDYEHLYNKYKTKYIYLKNKR